MKIEQRQLAAFLKSPDPGVRAVLVYGPDQGQVRERAESLARAVVPDLKDPFRVADLSWADLAGDPGRLVDEAGQLAFGGGRRVVRVRGPGEANAKVIDALLGAPPFDALVVMEGGDLAKSHAGRKRAEDGEAIAAIACYADEESGIRALLSEVLRPLKLRLDPDAEAHLLGHLGGDRGVSRRELEKLVLYVGREGATVTLEDVEACIGDRKAHDVDAIVDAVGEGQLDRLDLALKRAYAAGESPIALLRRVMGHFQRLHLAAGAVAAGETADAAVARMRPPIFFKRRDSMTRQVRRWTIERAETALDLLLEAEIACKSTGAPDRALCRQALLRIAVAARR